MATIAVTYTSIDGCRKARSFKTLAGARKFATAWIGATPDIGSNYAVSNDGVGKITVRGCTPDALFHGDAPTTEGYRIEAMWDGEEGIYLVWFGDRRLAAYDTYPEAAEHVGLCKQNDAEMECSF